MSERVVVLEEAGVDGPPRPPPRRPKKQIQKMDKTFYERIKLMQSIFDMFSQHLFLFFTRLPDRCGFIDNACFIFDSQRIYF